MLPLASSINSQFQYRGDMQARSKRRSKVSVGAMGLVDNIIAVTVYVVVAGLALSELYRFVQRAVSR
jgi:cobalamin biosynthesis protein CobD/CbiB